MENFTCTFNYLYVYELKFMFIGKVTLTSGALSSAFAPLSVSNMDLISKRLTMFRHKTSNKGNEQHE